MGKNQLWGRLGKGGRRQGAAGFGIWGTNQSWPGRKGKGVGGKAPGGKKGGLSRLECLLALRRVPPLSAMTSSDCMPQWSPHRVTQGAHSGAKERSPLGLRRVGGGKLRARKACLLPTGTPGRAHPLPAPSGPAALEGHSTQAAAGHCARARCQEGRRAGCAEKA